MASEAAETRHFFPDLKRNSTPTSSGSTVVSYTSDLGADKPILTLIHGYPQSSYEWRYVVPALLKLNKVSLFVPELPGYGISSPSRENSRLDIGSALLEALQKVFGITEGSKRKVILGGHDRGGRICHRLAVSRASFPALDVIGAIIMDIVPTKIQWEKFSDPVICSGYFHWPLLANVEISCKLIKAYGGGQWTRDANERIAGNEKGRARVQADGAVDVYAALFDKEETLKYSALDYYHGSAEECENQAADQQAGKKVEVPTLVMFSKAKLGARIDVEHEWRAWIKEGVEYKGVGVGDGYGHYLPEEAHETVIEEVTQFLNKHVK